MTTQSASKTALITGASAGLGRDFAELFAADGHNVVLVARREPRLQELKSQLEAAHQITATVIAVDLTEAGAGQTISDVLEAAQISIDFLVNNAGFGTNGAFIDQEPQRELDMVAVNITSVVHLTRLFIPDMVKRGFGRILNVGSTAGFQAGPFMATYYASKAFVNHFSEALSHELAGTGVTVTVSCPGPTKTEFGDVSGNGKTNLFKGRAARSEDVARHAYKAMMNGGRMAIPGLKNKLLVQTLRLAPRAVAHRIAARLNKPVND